MKQILPRDTLNPNSLTCIKVILLYINFSKIPRKSGYVTEKHESEHYLLYIYRNHKPAETQWPSSIFQTAAVGLLTAGAAAAKGVQTGSASPINTPRYSKKSVYVTHLLCPTVPSFFREADLTLVF